MIKQPLNLPGRILSVLTVCLLTVWVAPAQQQQQGGRPQGVNRGGGAIGGGRALGGGTGGAGSRQYYPSGAVGEAMVSSDPETRRLIVITDDETSQYISQVITNLDVPKPQVLIKVVFLEVTYRNSLDIGIEGGGATLWMDQGAQGPAFLAFRDWAIAPPAKSSTRSACRSRALPPHPLGPACTRFSEPISRPRCVPSPRPGKPRSSRGLPF